MNKLYSSHSILAAIVITKIALPATITQNCDNVSNLEWVTAQQNILHAFSNSLMSSKGEKNGRAKLTMDQVK
ncbi:hypothetical protein ONJ87_27885, partial [Salmonella enterica subsp. enterica serovar Anatum]|nr:hypothetical protein [Salmonella enterica subsp. enterica serovar Anatum]